MKFISQRIPAILLAALLGAVLGCQSAQKSTFMPPPQAPPLAPRPAAPAASKPEPAPTPTSTAQSQAKPEPAKPAFDPVADLIARVEKEYQAGLDNYRAGRREAAEQNFDAAFDLLLKSGLDLQSDERLSAELDRILDGTSDTQLEALQTGDTIAQQKSEPAPIDEANEVTPPVDASVKAKAEAEIKSTHSDLPLMMTDQVAGYITYFSNRGRGVLERGLARSGRYEDMIRSTLQKEGVPQDLIYLAQAESGFHPLAVSRAGARGMWQFMASRGRAYGLERTSWIDDRQDPEKATRAAARHLKDLYSEFGDWYLAMAAYNSGPGTVLNAVKRTGYADFWELYRRNVLPKETRNYVPIIVAVTIMAKNPDQYGLSRVVKEEPVPFDTVKINYPIDLRLVADCVDATPADIQDLNPGLLRLTTPKLDPGFDLRLPVGSAEKFESAIASIPVDQRLWWRLHTVQEGETVASIARTYRTTPKSIADANHLEQSALATEARLVIPIAPGKQSDGTAYARAITRYKIRKGDSIETVAENFGVSAKMVRVWNRMKGNSLAGRRILLIHMPVTPGPRETQLASSRSARAASARASTAEVDSTSASATSAGALDNASPHSASPHNAGTQAAAVVHHKVKPGETLYSIATSYNTTVSALKHDNRNIAVLRPGMILIVHGVR